MKHFLKSETGAAVMWVFGSLLMAAVITPWLYLAGKNLAAAAETGDLPMLLEWLGAACGRAKFGRFFDRAMLLSALCLLPILWRRVKMLKAASGMGKPLPQARLSKQSAAIQIAAGCIIAGSLLWMLGMFLDAGGAYFPKSHGPAFSKILSKIIIPAVLVSLMEEWLFRGVLLGLWLRSSRPAIACLGTSLLFAFLHFLHPPAAISNPGHALAGFELLGKIFLHFTDPHFFVTDFATLTVVGLILAWARVRTAALWFSIGLHSGWILAFQSYSLFYKNVPGHPLHPWGVGDNLRSGILPLATLGLTAVVCHYVLKRLPQARLAAHHGDHKDLEKTGTAERSGTFVDGGTGGEHVID